MISSMAKRYGLNLKYSKTVNVMHVNKSVININVNFHHSSRELGFSVEFASK